MSTFSEEVLGVRALSTTSVDLPSGMLLVDLVGIPPTSYLMFSPTSSERVHGTLYLSRCQDFWVAIGEVGHQPCPVV